MRRVLPPSQPLRGGRSLLLPLRTIGPATFECGCRASLDPPVTGQFEPLERQTLVPPIVVFDERDVMPLVVRFAATIEEAYKFVEVEFVDVVFVKIAVAAVERPIEVPLIEPPLIVAKPSVALFAFKFVVVTTPEI